MSRSSPEQQHLRLEDPDLELLKAVAQAWHAQSANLKPANEFHAHRGSSAAARKPSRFMLEAREMASSKAVESSSTATWDFAQSLWDSYEIVTLAKKLEANMALDHPMQSPPESGGRRGKRSRGSKNSLRNLFNMSSSSRRFDDDVDAITRDQRL